MEQSVYGHKAIDYSNKGEANTIEAVELVINENIAEVPRSQALKSRESMDRMEKTRQVQLAYLDQVRQTKSKDLSRVLNMQLNKIQETVQDSESTQYLRSFEQPNFQGELVRQNLSRQSEEHNAATVGGMNKIA